MNLADSIKLVLKNGQSKINIFLNEDVKIILQDFFLDWIKSLRDYKFIAKRFKEVGIKVTLSDLAASIKNLIIIFKYLPKRIIEGLLYFRADFLDELENCDDPKEKTILSLKVFGALTHFIIKSFYEIKKGDTKIKIKGMSSINAITHLIIAELVFKITSLFLIRFFETLESQVSSEDAKNHFIYLKQLLSKKEIDENLDISVLIVEKFKKYIMTGER